jgi:CheY-like chemotaxis protein
MQGSGRAAESGQTEHEPLIWQGWPARQLMHLMSRRVDRILLVCSAYDAYAFEEDGLLSEAIYSEYIDLGLTHVPTVKRVSTGEAALTALREEHFDLVITMLRLGDMDLARFVEAARSLAPATPVVLLALTDIELVRVSELGDRIKPDALYLWNGDTKLFLAIIKVIEDRWNAEQDTRLAHVGTIILVEDAPRFRSSLLPIMYSELVRQMRTVAADGINRAHKLLRMRARPKILVAQSYEEGLALYEKFGEYLCGVISDVSFPRAGRVDPQAGIDFLRRIRADYPDIPALLQSSDPANQALAEALGVHFLYKRSPTLLQDLRRFMVEHFGFGAFVFRMPDGREVAQARDLREMARALSQVPAESLEYHARRNHFSNWLRARTELELARRLRPRRVSEFKHVESIRDYLIREFTATLRANRRGVIEDFARDRFDEISRFVRLGAGSVGGKARGLAFADALLAGANLEDEFPQVQIEVPPFVVIGTSVFDDFVDRNDLRGLALHHENDGLLFERFLGGALAPAVVEDLRYVLRRLTGPLAVRSSSLLEDSPYHPFAGIYHTHMIPNNHADEAVRLQHLLDAIRLVYASTFSTAARRYLASTAHRIEEEKMAVIIQPLVGSRHGDHYYPNFAGAARSYNYYPFAPARPEDGIALVALGLGKLVVDGGPALRFCPAYPLVLPQLWQGEDFLDQSQRHFYALDLSDPGRGPAVSDGQALVWLDLEVAEREGTLAPVASVWSDADQKFCDGLHGSGPRAVTFAHVLKSELFPLARILQRLLQIGQAGFNQPVEIEFAVDLDAHPPQLAILQLRASSPAEAQAYILEVGTFPDGEILCRSRRALGHGVIRSIRDIVYVPPERFDPLRTGRIAEELRAINAGLHAAGRAYLLIGPGRWGSSTPTLGIPVNWADICGARVIIEAVLDNYAVEPSQGSHFFHNLICFGVAYLTADGPDAIDWGWLASRPAAAELEFVRHVRLERPIEVRINGRSSEGVVLKRLWGPE